MSVIIEQPTINRLLVAPAAPVDADRISELTHEAAPDCIPLASEEVEAHLPEFEVVRDDGVRVVAAASVRDIDGERAELRGLTVAPEWRGHGLGGLLVRRAIIRALDRGRNLVCVTRRREFFAHLGFRQIPLGRVPEKPALPHPVDGAPPRVAMAFRPLDLAEARGSGGLR